MTSGSLEDIIAHTKAYGFLFPSSEIYGGIQAVYDYGPWGAALKERVKTLWMDTMLKHHTKIVGLDAAIFMHPKVWEASGHLEQFDDLFIDSKESQKRYRVDHMVEEYIQTHAVSEDFREKWQRAFAGGDLDQILHFLKEEAILEVQEKGNATNWTAIRRMNLMFPTQLGAQAGNQDTAYLRPETAQGIYVNFLQTQKSLRLSLPFGIAQIGKAFRNELIARQFIFRMREFEQMEMQFFVPPDEEKTWFSFWKEARRQWYVALGIPEKNLQLMPHEKLAHYASDAVDIVYDFPFGFKEVEGIHARGNFDLSQHERASSKKIRYFDSRRKTSYIPHVVESSVGLDRLCLMILCHAFVRENVQGKERVYLRFPPYLAPVQVAIFPLVAKEGLPERAQRLRDELKYEFAVFYEEAASIGKRYTRQDLIGTPYCVTIDHETLADEKVTLRDRDNMKQERVPISKIKDILKVHFSTQSFWNSLPA
ncbi:MAG: glycine--tRNA ligase [Cytophagales bacterium]|nr:glycine--tRNA ligase [Cytophagales bacterium]